jgi:uncharacterized repeat protein (TIGR03803 family)
MDPALTRASWAPDQAPESILYYFKSMSTGFAPLGGVVANATGSLYGTTSAGGLVFPSGNTPGGGAVFKLTPKRSGYAESVIYNFGASGPADGDGPYPGNALAMDSRGALYGTTEFGGAFDATACGGPGGYGCGIVYKLEPTAHGYKEAILYTFLGASDGGFPTANPIVDRCGVLYGTTTGGGFGGSVYKLTPTKSGYSFSVLYTFGNSKNDGAQAWGALLRDEKTGDLYGTTLYGGINQNGIVFRLRPTASGYRYTIIHMFDGVSGGHPYGSLIMDAAGALYGTTSGTLVAPGGTCVSKGGGCGNVYKLTPTSTGYAETVLHEFTGGADGGNPLSPVVADRSGNLYTITSNGGQYDGGTVIKLVPTRSGYREVTLHSFNPTVDGQQYLPTSLLIDGDYLLGETAGSFKVSPAGFGDVFALKIP